MTHLLLYTDTLSEGYVILITGLIIVFTGLLLLTLFFKFGLPFMLYAYKMVSKGPDKEPDKKTEKIKIVNEDFTGEIAAAISVALHMYLDERHDNENAILTIKQARKLYSPWSSKIYGTYNNRF